MGNRLMSGDLEIVKNSPEYWEFIRELRNHKDTKKGFVSQDHITKQEHGNYMSIHGEDYVICLCGGKPAGFAGSVNGDIRVATHPDFLRMGVAEFLVGAVHKNYPLSHAKVKVDNQASLKLFKKCGFKIKYYLLERD